ncbi:MAG: hypothetical protein V9E95_13835, partial [Methanothrix soehngenii]
MPIQVGVEMMALKPWYKVINPLEDLREGKSLVASEFAVHLDQIRDQSGHKDYTKPDRFFISTYLTEGLISLASEVLRRLSGDISRNAVFNMATQFGGGKTHALALLYHLRIMALKPTDSWGSTRSWSDLAWRRFPLLLRWHSWARSSIPSPGEGGRANRCVRLP